MLSQTVIKIIIPAFFIFTLLFSILFYYSIKNTLLLIEH